MGEIVILLLMRSGVHVNTGLGKVEELKATSNLVLISAARLDVL